MRYWPTLVMVLVLAGLGLYLYVIEFPQKESHERQDTADKKVLLFDQETLSGLTIKTDRHELVFARTPEQGWVLTAPLNTEADQREGTESDPSLGHWHRDPRRRGPPDQPDSLWTR